MGSPPASPAADRRGRVWEPSQGSHVGAYVVQGGFLGLPGAQLQEILDAVLSRGAPVRFQARGFSMHPFIRDLDVVTVSPLPRRSLRAGDVIAFCQAGSGSLVLHRILRAGPDGFLVRGDNLPAPDGLVPPHDVIGLVTLAERNGAVAYRAADADGSEAAHAVLMVRLRLSRAVRAARRVAGELVRAWLSRGAADSRCEPEH